MGMKPRAPRPSLKALADQLQAVDQRLARLENRDKFYHGQSRAADAYNPNPDDPSACVHCGQTAEANHTVGCPMGDGAVPPHVVDARGWSGNATREQRAILGIIQAVAETLGPEALVQLDGAARDQETGLGPIAFAQAVLGPPKKGRN